MNTENIKKIAEGLYPDMRARCSNESTGTVFLSRGRKLESRKSIEKSFNPYESEADAFKVLEALVNRCPNMLTIFNLKEVGFEVNGFKHGACATDVCTSGEVKDLKHAICSAYLSLIDNKRV